MQFFLKCIDRSPEKSIQEPGRREGLEAALTRVFFGTSIRPGGHFREAEKPEQQFSCGEEM